jgi:transposase-like protein
MDPRGQFCHNPDCPATGRAGEGNIGVHSAAERRYVCRTCDKTFAATKGTPFYRLKKGADLATTVLTLLCHGRPPKPAPAPAAPVAA